MTEQHRPHTTGRLSTRMTAADQAKLTARLQPYIFHLDNITSSPAVIPAQAGIHDNKLCQGHSIDTYKQIEVELGLGNGLALFERAKANPDTLYLGSEIYLNGLRSLVNRLEQTPAVTNVRLAPQDARDLLPALPAHSIHRVCIFYPDPWPKKKHHKRRLIQPELLTAIARILHPEGDFWFVSDIPDYVFYTLTTAYQHGTFHPTATSPSHWATAPDWWVPTKYEQKALREGRFPWYLCFAQGN